MIQLLEYAWGQTVGFRRIIAKSFSLLILLEILGLMVPLLFGKIINDLNKGGGGAYIYIAMAFFIMAGSDVAQFLKERIDLRHYFFDISKTIERDAFQKLLKMSVGQHMNMNSGVVQSDIGSGISAIKDLIILALFQIVPNIIYIILTVIALTILSWKLAISVVVLGSVSLLLYIKLNEMFAPRLLHLQEMRRKQGKYRSERMRNVTTVKLLGQERRMIKEYDEEIGKVNELAKEHWLGYMTRSHLIRFLNTLTVISSLVVGTYLINRGEHDAGTFVVFYSWVGGIVSRIGMLRGNSRELAQLAPPIRKYLDLVEEKPEIDENGTITDIPYGRIEFRNVSFKYKKKRQHGGGLEDVTLEINPGETVGIVGMSGAGKSTLVKLLLRGHDPDSGGIYIDGVALPHYAPSYRTHIGYVQQEEILFDDTIRYNMELGLDHHLSDEELWKALSDVALESRIRKSEHKLDTIVGERGIKLSGGERQRLTIARAALMKPRILILDEATSHLDVENEHLVSNNVIRRVAASTTTIMIAHRFATLKSCNRIIVMHKGRLIGFDSHEALLETCSIYKMLVDRQNLSS